MKYIKLSCAESRENVLKTIVDNRLVNENVRFAENIGKPTVELKERGEHVRIRCRMVGGPSKDNGYIMGTYFTGTLKEREGVTTLKGVILTEPILHIIWFLLVVYFVFLCFRMGGFSIVPILFCVLIYFMFRSEYQKQPILARYLSRAFSRVK